MLTGRRPVVRNAQCIKVDCVSTRTEHFYDLALNVAGCADLYASLDKFVEVETLDGANKYRSDQYGLQVRPAAVCFCGGARRLTFVARRTRVAAFVCTACRPCCTFS